MAYARHVGMHEGRVSTPNKQIIDADTLHLEQLEFDEYFNGVMDVIVWGLTALVLQLVMFRLVDFVVRGLSTRIENGEMASAAVLVGVKIGGALLTASALNG